MGWPSGTLRALLEAVLPPLRFRRVGAFEVLLMALVPLLLPGGGVHPAVVGGSGAFLYTLFAGAGEGERVGVRVPFEGTPLGRPFTLGFRPEASGRDRWRWGAVYALPWGASVGLFWGGVLGLEGPLALGGLFLSLLGREVFLRCPRKPPGGP